MTLQSPQRVACVVALLAAMGFGPLAAEAWRAEHPTEIDTVAVTPGMRDVPDHVLLRGWTAGRVGPYLSLASTREQALAPQALGATGGTTGGGRVLVEGIGPWAVGRGVPVALTGRMDRAWPKGLGLASRAGYVLRTEAGVAPAQWLRAIMALGVAIGVLVAFGGRTETTEEPLPARLSRPSLGY